MSENRPPSPPAPLGCFIVLLLEWVAICSLLMLMVTGVLKPAWSQEDTARRPASTRVVRQAAPTATFAAIAAAEPSPILEAPTALAEPSATPEPSATAEPSATPEPTKVLAITRSNVVDAFTPMEYVFEESSSVKGQARFFGKHNSKDAIVEVIGPLEQVIQASVAVGFDDQTNSEQIDFYTDSMLALLAIMTPEWTGRFDWLASQLGDLSKGFDQSAEYKTTVDEKTITLQALALGKSYLLILTVEYSNPEVSQPGANPDVTLSGYLTAITSPMTKLEAAFKEVERLFGSPRFGDPAWNADVGDTLRVMQEVYSEFKAIQDVPQEAEELHKTLVSATADCDAMVKPVQEALDTLSVEKLEEGATLLESCSKKINQSTEILKRLLGLSS